MGDSWQITNPGNSMGLSYHGDTRTDLEDSLLYPRWYPNRLKNKNITKRLVAVQERPHKIALNMVNCVCTLERWWWAKYGEERNIERMPPTDLDKYLVEFFPILKRSNGVEYNSRSLTNYRTLLDRFLKDHHYPRSITQQHVDENRALIGRSRELASPGNSTGHPMGHPDSQTGLEDSMLYPRSYPPRLNNENIKRRVIETSQRSRNITMNMVSCICTLERWWWARNGEERNIEHMPPTDLDQYLTEFFRILKRSNGEGYSPESFTNFRSLLDRFLKDHNYPHSISKSVEFFNSQQAFSNKRRELRAQRYIKQSATIYTGGK